MLDIAAVLLPFVAVSSWYLGRGGKGQGNKPRILSRDYLIGLNYLLNEQPDKAVDIFIKMLEVDSETIETHLALGNLFRRRGEVDRAIRIHQNLISRSNLEKSQRIQALLSLGRDYMLAGVLDRAERLFQEVIESGEYTKESLTYLQDIYQQEKDWEQAIVVAEKLEMQTGCSMSKVIAHYYCELAEEAYKNNKEQAQRLLKRAIAVDHGCVRATLLNGQWQMEQGYYRQAIDLYFYVKEQDPDYLSEAIKPLVKCYQYSGDEVELIQFLRSCLVEHPRISVMLELSDRLQHYQGEQIAADFLATQLREHTSFRGLSQLIKLQVDLSEGTTREKLQLLHGLTIRLLKDKPVYRCGHCGYAGKVLHWQCPSCRHWDSIKPLHGLEGD